MVQNQHKRMSDQNISKAMKFVYFGRMERLIQNICNKSILPIRNSICKAKITSIRIAHSPQEPLQGESSKEAFMRRLKKSDPAYDIYATYAEEHTERWAAAKSLSMDEALAQMPEIERKYKLECEEMG